MPIEIRSYTPDLQQQVVDLILPIQREEFGFDVTVADQPDLLEIHDFYQSGAGGFWVAMDGGHVVGTIGLRDIGNRQGALRKMFVAATHRGKAHGVAARLVQQLVDAAQPAGVPEVFLGTTERFLAAHRFYERQGFERIEVGQLPAAFPRMALDTRFYRRRIGPMPGPARTGVLIYAKNLLEVSAFYEQVLHAAVRHADAEHRVLESADVQLIIHAIPEPYRSAIVIEAPPVAREEQAIKPFFTVDSLAAAEAIAERCGGRVWGPVWPGPGLRVRNVCDPEGNIVHLRERAG